MTQDSKFFQICTRITDLIIVNVIHVICCLPIFTIGAAFSALYCVTLKMANDEETTPIRREYFRAFRNNFKQGTVLWLGCLAFGVFLYLDFRISTAVESSTTRSLLAGFVIVAAILLVSVMSYLFPLVAWFENSNRQMLKNAMILAASRLQYTVPLVIVNLTPLLAVFVPGDYLKWMFAAYFFIWFSGVAFINGRLLRHIFDEISGAEGEK